MTAAGAIGNRGAGRSVSGGPHSVSFEHATTLGLAGRTALRVVRLAGPLLGRSVLILGASGGVGHLTVQLAAHAGALVTVHTRASDRAGDLLDGGAERVLYGEGP